MKFRNHVFISYAHDNNRPVEEGARGWVECFHGALDAFLGRRYGKARVWRDERLRGNDDFSAEIYAQFPDTALMVSVISPSYLKSEWCRAEADRFCTIAEQPPGLVIENKMRAFKVILEPVADQTPLPPAMRDALGFEFFVREGSKLRELDPVFGPEMRAKFHLAVADLAGEIADLLRKLEDLDSGAAVEQSASVPAERTVYLAECSFDRREDRKALNAELRARNFRVLPERELPRDEAEYRAEVSRLLEQCALSVHLVGGVLGSVPDGPSGRSGVMIQNELAAARSAAAALKRVISLPAGTRSESAEQQAFIEAIERDAQTQFGAEVISAGLETVKTAVQAALTPKPPSLPPLGGDGSGAPAIYVIFDAKDRKDEALLRLRKHLQGQGFVLRKPAFEGTAEEVRLTHEQHLTESDAVVIYYGAGTDAWKLSIDRDVEKAKGRGGDRRLRAVFHWIAPLPWTDDKGDVIDLGGERVVDARGGEVERLADGNIVQVLRMETSR